MTYRIYRLDCVDTGECLYVGATKHTVEHRAQQHRGKRSRVSRLLGNRRWTASQIQTCRDAAEAGRRETHWQRELRPLLNDKRAHTGYSDRGGIPATELMLLTRPSAARRPGRRATTGLSAAFAKTCLAKIRRGDKVADYELSAALGYNVIPLIERGYLTAERRQSARLRLVFVITATEAKRWLSGRGVLGF